MRQNVEVIIVTYNNADCIADCLKSLERVNEQIIMHATVVDNASTDNTLTLITNALDGSDDWVKVIRNHENLGYAYGNNIAINFLKTEAAQYAAVLILNPDVILSHGVIDKLLALLQDSDNVGAVAPNVIEPGQAIRPNKFKTLWGGGQKRYAGHGNVIEADRLHGGCMLIKPELFNKIGLFDESYFLYWEEIDLCQRARKADFKLLYIDDVVVTHRGDSQSGLYRTHRIYYMWRNQFYFSFKNYGRIVGMAFLLRRFLSNSRELLLFTLSGRFDLCAAGLAGMIAGIRGERNRSTNRYAQTERQGFRTQLS